MKIEIEVDPDWIDNQVVEELKRCYIDNVECWRFEDNFEELSNALLTVIQHYSVPSEYKIWYETIKEL